MKLNINFDQWEELNNVKFDEDFILSKLNKVKKNNYLFLKKILLKNNIFNVFFDKLFNDRLVRDFNWYINLIEDNVELTNENRIIYFFNTNKRLDLIDMSFNWRRTMEGHNYWLNFKIKFLDNILNDITKKRKQFNNF